MVGFISRFLYHKFVCLIHTVIRFISTNLFSLKVDVSEKINLIKTEEEQEDDVEFRDFDEHDDEEEEDKSDEIYLKFKFPTFEEFSKIQKEATGDNKNNNIFSFEVGPSTRKCELTYGKNFMRSSIDELEDDSDKFGDVSKNEEGLSDANLVEAFDQALGVHDKGKGVLVIDGVGSEKSGVKSDEISFSDENSVITDTDSESTSFDNLRVVMSRLVDSYSDGFLSDGDFRRDFVVDSEHEKVETDSELSGFEDNHGSSDDFSDEESDIMEELKNLEEEEDDLKNGDGKNSDFLSDNDFSENVADKNDAEVVTKSDKGVNESSEDVDEFESLWEHQELIEQLKMELKKVRATGLPTILEESESPKLMDDLKPWKIDEFQREDCLGELHKFYKSYRERMRKFDIINYQKMYAMGFLQLKDPLQSISKQKPSPPTLKSLVSQNRWLFKHKIHGTDPMKKFIQELQGDLEAVYVGQMCLSWEFLHWQYEKALDLWDSDPRGIRRYNEVAGEFQQFQVLMQRFIEDGPFQGPRVQNYVKTRCAVRNLLQVPVIREDNLKDKRKARTKATDEYVITSDILVETVEESIRIFWQFVRADKDCTSSTINGHKKTHELSNPEDLKLLTEVKKTLLKKERKLKDILRSENCVLRKFRQCREDDTDDQVLYFFSQVDMKLVCRVLNMSKVTRDQLIWCHNKLNRISFVNRKIQVEPGFLLFPC